MSTHGDISKSDSSPFDPEKHAEHDPANLVNKSVDNFNWSKITVTVRHRQTRQPFEILSNVTGTAKAGELLALMGPSGSGKTTLLNTLAHRTITGTATVEHSIRLNGAPIDLNLFRKLSSYVEQDDVLVGSLTVRETLSFAARLALPRSVSKADRLARVNALISAFGLQQQAETLIGTPIRKGVSGGQKRRVSVASQLISEPKILFLDEPTSGLDSAASYEVVRYLRDIAKKYKIIVIASIHQPSTVTFELFDNLLLLSRGAVVYGGPVPEVRGYFAKVGHHMPLYINPAEYIIQLVNTDFSQDHDRSVGELDMLQSSWRSSGNNKAIAAEIERVSLNAVSQAPDHPQDSSDKIWIPVVLIHRSFIKSYRDIVAYGIRIAMYMGLAIMMGTVWLRLSPTQSNINAFTNAIFFGGAFMSFMAVAYIPAYLEDLHIYTKERLNGLYGPTAFMIANFFIGLPYLFVITILFSVISYWLGNFRPAADGFWIWVMWLFLDLIAAESLVVLLSSMIPIFVVALAATAFANGLWMSVNGFMVQPDTLNVFWRYVFHYIDYQGYVFRGMMVNEFGKRNYACEKMADEECYCMFPSRLQDQCMIEGRAVLSRYGYDQRNVGKYVGYMLVIILGYRILGWLVLYLKKH